MALSRAQQRGLGSDSFRAEPLLQVADLISGSIARAVDPKKASSRSKDVLELISKRSVGIEFWPPVWAAESLAFLDERQNAKHDELVRRHCMKQARLFLQRLAPSSELSEDLRAQAEVLQYLLFHVQFVDSEEFITAAAIAEWLGSNVGIVTTAQQLRFHVARLRDADVLISSSPKGYKVPTSVADMTSFALHANTIVPPMLIRLERAQRDLHAASLGQLDILQHDNFSTLNRLIRTMMSGDT